MNMGIRTPEDVAQTRVLAERTTLDGFTVTLIWGVDSSDNNHTWIVVVGNHRGYAVEVDPKVSFHAYTHAGLYVPEAWEGVRS